MVPDLTMAGRVQPDRKAKNRNRKAQASNAVVACSNVSKSFYSNKRDGRSYAETVHSPKSNNVNNDACVVNTQQGCCETALCSIEPDFGSD